VPDARIQVKTSALPSPLSSPVPPLPNLEVAGNGKAPQAAISVTGLVLMDSSMNPVAFNNEAIHILTFPKKPGAIGRLEVFLADKIRSGVLKGQDSAPGVTDFKSGNRHYLCRAFLLQPNGQGNHSGRPSLALLLERSNLGFLTLPNVTEQFRLTGREHETVECLLLGLTSKEMANRMSISPNTVKTFVRQVMTKMGVSSRLGIIGKVVGTKP
jgi:DNA-binding CsgD family transcriptional regulator